MAQDERRPFDIIEDFPFMLTLEAFRTSSQHPVELGTLNSERGRARHAVPLRFLSCFEIGLLQLNLFVRRRGPDEIGPVGVNIHGIP